MSTEKTQDATGNNPEIKSFETSAIWEEAGFIPPGIFMELVEDLHKSEGKTRTVFIRELIPFCFFCCTITDSRRMHDFAGEMSIPVEGRGDMVIAREILTSLISEYSGENLFNSKTTKNLGIFFPWSVLHENEVMRLIL